MASMNPLSNASMNVQVSGKNVDVGDSLRRRITDELIAGVGKYFERGSGTAEVVLSREGHYFKIEVNLLLGSGQQVVADGMGGDAHAAFDDALTKTEKRVRRYHRRLTNHHPHLGGPRSPAETAPLVVLRAPEDDGYDLDEEWGNDGSAGNGAPSAMIIAETEAPVKTQTVSMAVMDLDLTDTPVVVFRNVAHGGLSVVYRRQDGNIGWIDPERTRAGEDASPAQAQPLA